MIQGEQQQVNVGAHGCRAWEILAEPMVIPYATVNKDGTWHGVGDRILPGKHLIFFFEKNIKRVQDKSLTKIQFAFEINGVRSCFYQCYEVWLSVLTEF
jgi:hypothetical protein